MIRTGIKYIQKENPIKKILPDENVKINMLEGKVIEIIDKIDIGKHFSVNIENQFVAILLKDLLKNTISQIMPVQKIKIYKIVIQYLLIMEY
ncbi:MAG: hypothetical protein LBG43_03770 [Treponema sp.]|jgi:hypothetical protein|nr:hypothetical protein [Treponema sp.]